MKKDTLSLSLSLIPQISWCTEVTLLTSFHYSLYQSKVGRITLSHLSMAQQEEGWPLGLQPLNGRVGLVRINHENDNYLFGSTSFHTLLTASAPCSSSTDFSSDLDTQSTGSFFHDNSTTLGTLMGVSTINNLHDLPRRSSSVIPKGRSRPAEVIPTVKKKNTQLRPKTWCLSLCPRNTKDAKIENTFNNTPSLAQFLALERRANNGGHRIGRDHCPIIYGPDDGLALAQPVTEPNSLFVDGCVAPPRSSPLFRSGLIENGSKGCGIPFLLYCICGQDIHWIDLSLNFLCFFLVD